jgi:hypothetical protein
MKFSLGPEAKYIGCGESWNHWLPPWNCCSPWTTCDWTPEPIRGGQKCIHANWLHLLVDTCGPFKWANGIRAWWVSLQPGNKNLYKILRQWSLEWLSLSETPPVQGPFLLFFFLVNKTLLFVWVNKKEAMLRLTLQTAYLKYSTTFWKDHTYPQGNDKHLPSRTGTGCSHACIQPSW